ncbi:hypothetical protein E2562_021411, partial [Oryza meyeriana var. granulata]
KMIDQLRPIVIFKVFKLTLRKDYGACLCLRMTTISSGERYALKKDVDVKPMGCGPWPTGSSSSPTPPDVDDLAKVALRSDVLDAVKSDGTEPHRRLGRFPACAQRS